MRPVFHIESKASINEGDQPNNFYICPLTIPCIPRSALTEPSSPADRQQSYGHGPACPKTHDVQIEKMQLLIFQTRHKIAMLENSPPPGNSPPVRKLPC